MQINDPYLDQYCEYLTDFLIEECNNDFSLSLDPIDKEILDNFAQNVMTYLSVKTKNVSPKEFSEIIHNEINKSLKIGFAAHVAYDRYFLNNFENIKKERKFSLRKLIIKLLDKFNIE